MKKKKVNKEIDLGKIFLTDKALLKVEDDELGHSDYAELLLKLVSEQQTPFNIGIFGKWGVGKSSIVNLLKDKLNNDIKRKKITFIEVKVWKYDEKISLTRKFIVNIAEGLGLSDDLNDLNKEIYYDREFETALLNFKEIVSTIFNRKSIALWIMTGSLALLILFRILNIINVENPIVNRIFKIGEDSVLIPLVPAIFFWIIEIINKAKLKLKIGRYDSDEQFENKFIELVKKDKSKKIIFIDDLDRCSKEKVVKALETIKTFLDVETCIFIIACDDEIIKKAINKSKELYENGNSEGAEYLEKFFQYTLRIPPILQPDMRKFILNLLKKNGSDLLKLDETLEDIIFITINNNVKSPRNAITALNEFSASYVLANNREASSSSRLHERKITDNLPILAIVTSIRSHFPEFYNEMIKNSDMIFWLKDVLESNQAQLNEKQLAICEKYFHTSDEKLPISDEVNDEAITSKDVLLKSIDWNRPKHEEYKKLLRFIESIKDYLTIRDITPFLYIGVDTTSYLIGDESLQEFNDAMKNGIETRITKIIDEADESKTEHLFDHMLDWIEEKLEGIERRKALQILSKLLNKCPKKQLHRASRVFYKKFYRRNINYVEYKKFSQEGIFISAKGRRGSNQKDLIKQAINFLGCSGNDTNYDKLILQQIFNNEFLVNDKELIQKVITFLDKRKADATEKEESSELIDLNFVKNIIIEYKEHPNVIEKFFSGKIIEEVINRLNETEDQDEFNEEDYDEIVEVFEVLKINILDKNMHLLCEAYKSLITTNKYYSKILDDIEIRLDDIPIEEYSSLSISLINELGNLNYDKSIRRILDFCKYWFEKFDNVEDEELLENLTEKLIELSQNEDLMISNISLTYFTYFNKYLEGEQENKILQNYITQISPLQNLEKSRKLNETITNKKESLTKENRILLLNKIIKDLNSIDGLNNNEIYSFWKTILDEYKGVFEDGELDILVLPNNATNILHPNFPNATNDIRSIFCDIISKNFKKISSPKQNEYFEIFKTFLSTNSKINSEYAIENIYKLKSYLKDSPFLISSVNLFVQQLNIDIEPATKLKNINILFLCFEKLTVQQIDIVLEGFAANCQHDALGSVKVLLSNWEFFPNKFIISSIKSLLPTRVLDDDKLLDSILTNIESVFMVEDPVSFIEFLESDLTHTEDERNIYAKIIKHNSKYLKSDMKSEIKSGKIADITTESDIHLCRNKMSTLIAIKESDFEKDTEINDMFFRLLNDKKIKKHLALDVFEYYYEDRYPYKRKGALEERFNNLMSELDSNYKEKLRHLANKYELRVKKSFWDSIFG